MQTPTASSRMLAAACSVLLVWTTVRAFQPPARTARSAIVAPSNHVLGSSSSSSSSNDGQSYYGEPGSSFVLREINDYDDLRQIVALASQPLPERPDGIVCVVKYTSASRDNCRVDEAEYERLARDNPATLFLRCFEEYDSASLMMSKADVKALPTYDLYYGGNRVARVEGVAVAHVQEALDRYQFINSNLDLFSEEASVKRQQQWGDGPSVGSTSATPRTTARFTPGYDWNTDRGFFDTQAEEAQRSFEEEYENSWLPTLDDDNDNGNIRR